MYVQKKQANSRPQCAGADLVRCGVRFAGAGAVHVRSRFRPHVQVGIFCGLSPKYKNQNQNFKYIFETDRKTQQDNEMNEDLFE